MIEHWVVGTGPLDPVGAQFRRDRLARHLADLPGTDRVYWLHMRTAGRRPVEVARHENGMWQVGVRDVWSLVRLGVHVPLGRALRSQLDRSPAQRVLWYTHPSLPSLVRDRGWAAIVYDCSDLWSAGRELVRPGSRLDWRLGGRQRWLINAERVIVGRATCVVATNALIAQHLQRSYGRMVDDIVENGVDFQRFASARAESRLGRAARRVRRHPQRQGGFRVASASRRRAR